MSTFDTTLRVKGDTKDAVEAIKRLQHAVDGLGTGASKTQAGFGRFLSDIGTGFVKINQSLELLQKGMQALETGLGLAKFNAELEQLEKRVPIKTLQMLQEATDGAVSKLDLMKFAVHALNGDMALTEQGLHVVAKAADTLADKMGKDTVAALNALEHALRTGQTKALAEYGIVVDQTKSKQEQLNELWVKLQVEAAKGFETSEQMKSIERLQAATTDWMNDLRAGLGSILQTFVESLIEASDMLSGTRQSGSEKVREGAIRAMSMDSKSLFGQEMSESMINSIIAGNGAYTTDRKLIDAVQGQYKKYQAGMKGTYGGKVSGAAEDQRYKAQLAAAGLFEDPETGMIVSEEEYAMLVTARGRDGLGGMLGSAKGGKRGGSKPRDLSSINAALDSLTRDGTSRHLVSGSDDDLLMRMEEATYGDSAGPGFSVEDRLAQYRQQQEQSKAMSLSKQLGFDTVPIDSTAKSLQNLSDVLTEMNDRTTLAGAGWNALSAGMGAAIDAAISGSDGIGKAMAKAMATSLKATAVDAGVQALYNTAKGIAAAATGNPAAAATYFAAAAKFGATAVAAGVGAAVVGSAAGGSGGSGPSSAAGGGFAGNRGGSGEGGGETIIIQVGEGFVGDPKKLAEEIDTRMRSAKRAGRVRDGSNTVVRFQ